LRPDSKTLGRVAFGLEPNTRLDTLPPVDE